MALSTSDFLQACRFIAEDKDHDAVAYLVASLRANPANDAAVTRLATLLTYRTWLRPALDLKHTGRGLFRPIQSGWQAGRDGFVGQHGAGVGCADGPATDRAAQTRRTGVIQPNSVRMASGS